MPRWSDVRVPVTGSVSTDAQDLTAQGDALAALGVPGRSRLRRSRADRYHRDRPGLREALAACRAGDTLVVTKLDRLARSVPDARDIVEDLTRREVSLDLDGSVHRSHRPGRAAVVQRAGHGRRVRGRPHSMRTREGMKVARAGPLRGKQPKLSPQPGGAPRRPVRGGEHTSGELAELC